MAGLQLEAAWSGLKRLEASGIIWSAESSMTQSGSVLSSIFTWPREVPWSSQCPFRDQAAAAPLRCFFSATSANRRCSPCLSQSVSVTSLDSKKDIERLGPASWRSTCREQLGLKRIFTMESTISRNIFEMSSMSSNEYSMSTTWWKYCFLKCDSPKKNCLWQLLGHLLGWRRPLSLCMDSIWSTKVLKSHQLNQNNQKWCKVLAWAFENSWRTWKEQCQSLSLEGFLGSLHVFAQKTTGTEAASWLKNSPTGPHARLTFTILAPSRGHRPAVDPFWIRNFNEVTLTDLTVEASELAPRWCQSGVQHLNAGALAESCSNLLHFKKNGEVKDDQRWPKMTKVSTIPWDFRSNMEQLLQGLEKTNCKTAQLLLKDFAQRWRDVIWLRLLCEQTTSDNIWQYLTISHHHNVKITTSYSSYGRFMSFWDTRCHQISPGLSKRHFAKCRLTLLETSRNERFASKCFETANFHEVRALGRHFGLRKFWQDSGSLKNM